MTEKKPKNTVITIVLPPDGEEKPASINITQGDIGKVSTFTYTDFATICRAINTSLAGFAEVQENPPGDVESKAKKFVPTGKSSAKKKPKPAGKPPFHLIDASGKRRELKMMTDPFDVTEKCSKNKGMKFKELADAEEIALMLVEAGETKITIAYKNGKTAKIVTSDGVEVVDPALKDASDATTDTPVGPTSDDDTTEYPDSIDNPTKVALYEHLKDVDLVLAIYEEVRKTAKHDWTNNLIKQREVKATIHKHVEDHDQVEAVYQIFYDIEHVPTADKTAQSKSDDDTDEEPTVEADPLPTLI